MSRSSACWTLAKGPAALAVRLSLFPVLSCPTRIWPSPCAPKPLALQTPRAGRERHRTLLGSHPFAGPTIIGGSLWRSGAAGTFPILVSLALSSGGARPGSTTLADSQTNIRVNPTEALFTKTTAMIISAFLATPLAIAVTLSVLALAQVDARKEKDTLTRVRARHFL